MTTTVTGRMASGATGHDGFARVVHAEWTKFRTVRGWVIAMIVAIGAIMAVPLLSHYTCMHSRSGCPTVIGPGGEAVQDAYFFAHQPLTGNGTITAQITSLTAQYDNGQPTMLPGGLQPWSKAGIIIKENTSQGSAYAAMMATGSNGVRMQWNYVNDTPGLAGSVSASSPRWLRLARDGDTITGYDSADGTHWTLVGTVTLTGLTSTVQAGLFAATPALQGASTIGSGTGTSAGFSAPVLATGTFQHVGLSWPATGWAGTQMGGVGPHGTSMAGSYRDSAGTFTVSGSGDIAPGSPNGASSLWNALQGVFLGLIALVVVGAMFITAEYRRGLIRVSLTASPRRGRLLAAKVVVIGAVSFVTGLLAAALAVTVGGHALTAGGNSLLPIPALTEVRMVVGTALLLAVAAVLALAIGTIVRRSAVAVATVIVLVFVPYLFVIIPGIISQGTADWLLRLTPTAAFSIQQPFPAYPQVSAPSTYVPTSGYYPLSPWAGFAVECAWAAAALALAFYLLRSRDA